MRAMVRGGFPVSGRQKVKFEDRSTSSTSGTTSSGNTNTVTTGLSTHIDTYKEARKLSVCLGFMTAIADRDLRAP